MVLFSSRSLAYSFLIISVALWTVSCDQRDDPSPEEQMFEAVNYAKELGVDNEQAAERFETQQEAGDLERSLAEQEKDTFAGLWIEHKPQFRVVVQFTEQERAEEEKIKSYLPQEEELLAKSVDIRTAKFSLQQLVGAQQTALGATRNLKVPLDSGINIQENRVEIYVLDRAAFMSTLQGARVQLPQPVEVVQVKELSVPEVDIYGGVPLTTCTAGWPVRNAQGVLGITTAAHCGNTQRYKNVLLPFKAEKQSGSCDVQWHTAASYTVVPKFVGNGPANLRALKGTKPRSNQVVGGYVCKYGKTTNYTCGYITSKTVSLNYVTNSNATFIRVSRDNKQLSAGGDSGGPWFNGNIAYGVHSGGTSTSSVYMAIDYVPSCIGVNLLTQQ